MNSLENRPDLQLKLLALLNTIPKRIDTIEQNTITSFYNVRPDIDELIKLLQQYHEALSAQCKVININTKTLEEMKEHLKVSLKITKKLNQSLNLAYILIGLEALTIWGLM